MRCAPSLQSLKVHFIFLGGMPPRMGRAMWRVDEGGRREAMGAVKVPEEASVEVRCLPACTRRMSDVGADVRNESSWRRVDIVVSEGTVRGMAVFCFSVSFFFFGSLTSICFANGLVVLTYCRRRAAGQRDGSSRRREMRMLMSRRRLMMSGRYAWFGDAVGGYGIDR